MWRAAVVLAGIGFAVAGPKKPDARRERECEGQYQADNRTCTSLRKADVKQRCFSSATLRYGMCLRGEPLPPLITK